MPYPMFEIVENTLHGIEKAQEDYERWSGGYWLYQAPEYLMTTYVAKELAKHKEHSYYITLEHSTADAVAEVGGRIGETTGRFALLGEYWCGRCQVRCWRKRGQSAVDLMRLGALAIGFPPGHPCFVPPRRATTRSKNSTVASHS